MADKYNEAGANIPRRPLPAHIRPADKTTDDYSQETLFAGQLAGNAAQKVIAALMSEVAAQKAELVELTGLLQGQQELIEQQAGRVATLGLEAAYWQNQAHQN